MWIVIVRLAKKGLFSVCVSCQLLTAAQKALMQVCARICGYLCPPNKPTKANILNEL